MKITKDDDPVLWAALTEFFEERKKQAAELKPCPFCGGKAGIACPGGFVAVCSVCYAQGPGVWQSRAEAVFFWNERKEKTNDD